MPYLHYWSLLVGKGVLKSEHGNTIKDETSMEFIPEASPWTQPSLLLHGHGQPCSGLPKFTLHSALKGIFLLIMSSHLYDRTPLNLHQDQGPMTLDSPQTAQALPAMPMPHNYPQHWNLLRCQQGNEAKEHIFLPNKVIDLCKSRKKQSFFS